VVIVPAVLLHQWKLEIEKTPLRASYVSKKRDIDMDLTNQDVIVVIDSLFSLFSMRFSRTYWERIIVDEPQICKRLDPLRLKRSRFTWLITATPVSMIEKLKLFSIDFLEAVTVKHTKEELDHSIQISPIHYHDLRVDEPIHSICKNVLNPHQYALLKHKNFDALFHSLGYKKMEKKTLLEILEKKTQKPCMNTLNEYTCPICMDALRAPCATSCCYNFFCKECIAPLQKSCPLCRRSLDEHSLIDIIYDVSPLPTRVLPTTLYDVLKGMIPKWGDRVIVYTENIHLKHFLMDVAKEYALYELSGRSEDKVRSLESFRTTKSILFLTSVLHTCGLNLEWTTDVVLCEPLSDSVETQIIGRAYRLGRNVPLDVYRIL
jgi:SNF2 family DNA or RNA helicase